MADNASTECVPTYVPFVQSDCSSFSRSVVTPSVLRTIVSPGVTHVAPSGAVADGELVGLVFYETKSMGLVSNRTDPVGLTALVSMVPDETLSSTSININSDMPTISLFPPSRENAHPMITRAKAGIFKPKALAVKVLERELCNIIEAFMLEGWRLAAHEEYDALIRNCT